MGKNCVVLLGLLLPFVISFLEDEGFQKSELRKSYDKNKVDAFWNGFKKKYSHYKDVYFFHDDANELKRKMFELNCMDPAYPRQWYMNEDGFCEYVSSVVGGPKTKRVLLTPNLQLTNVHANNIKGESVRVVIVSNDVINLLHPDLMQVQGNSMVYDKRTFFGRVPQGYRMGYVAAGIIGMMENEVAGVGIAPKCKFANIVVDEKIKMSQVEEYIWNFINRIGPNNVDVILHVYARPSARNGVLDFFHKEADMLSSKCRMPSHIKPHVMGSGNDGRYLSTCQTAPFANMDTMFVFGSVDYAGYVTDYSESGASVFAVTYSTTSNIPKFNFPHSEPDKMHPNHWAHVVTIDDQDEPDESSNPLRFKSYANEDTGISGAMGAGVIALLIDIYKRKFNNVQPTVTSIAFLLAASCNNEMLLNRNTLWIQNGAGLWVSPQAGFGVPNVKMIFNLIFYKAYHGFPQALVYTLEIGKIIPIGTLKKWDSDSSNSPSSESSPSPSNPSSTKGKKRWFQFWKKVESLSTKQKRKKLTGTAQENLDPTSNIIKFTNDYFERTIYFEPNDKHYQQTIQEVGIIFSSDVPRRYLSIYLISHAGTVSCVYEGNLNDNSNESFSKQYFRSVHFLGETLGGYWRIRGYIYRSERTPLPSENYIFKFLEFKASLVKSIPTGLEFPNPIQMDTEEKLERDYNLLVNWVRTRHEVKNDPSLVRSLHNIKLGQKLKGLVSEQRTGYPVPRERVSPLFQQKMKVFQFAAKVEKMLDTIFELETSMVDKIVAIILHLYCAEMEVHRKEGGVRFVRNFLKKFVKNRAVDEDIFKVEKPRSADIENTYTPTNPTPDTNTKNAEHPPSIPD